MDRLVDPSAVNRWPAPALRRTVPGIVAGYLMGGGAWLTNQRMESIDRVQAAWGGSQGRPIQESEVVKWVQEALGAEQRPVYSDEVERVTRNNYALVLNAEPGRNYLDNLLSAKLQAMRSLRDVDEPADIVVESREDAVIMKGLQRG